MFKLNWPNNRLVLILIWLVAIGIRVYGATTPAQLYDIITFEAWSRSFWAHSPQAFFNSVWSDYLPLPILTFAPISVLADFFHAPFPLVFKLLHSAIELILIYFVAKSVASKFLIPVSFLLLLSPALIGDTSFWGQVDSIPALLALLSLSRSLIPNSSFLLPGILYGLAVAYKPIMILIAPVLWILHIKKGQWWQFPLLSGLTFLATGIPTGGWNFFAHLYARATEQAGTYPFLTINAFNFHSLVPVNNWVPDSLRVLGISGHTGGLILFSVFTLLALNHWRKTGLNAIYAYRIAATILILFYTFTTRMHERHLIFGLPFLALAVQNQKFILYPYFLLTTFFVLNLYGAFYWVNHAQTWPFGPGLISLISWGVTLTTIALTLVWSWPQFLKSAILNLKSNKALFGILVLASLLRFVNLSHPTVYIFDEVYHAFTAREYLHDHIEAWEWWTTPPEGVAYEWTHPPLAKYGMVLGMKWFGESSLGWRVGSAIAGVVTIFGLYKLVNFVTRQKKIALLAAFILSIEGLHIAQSRIAMNDSYMLVFFIWSLYAAVKSRWKLGAVLYGLSLASKWSALYGIVPLAFIYLHQNPIKNWSLKSSISHLLFSTRCLLIALSVYVLSFAPFILAGHTWAQWWELHRQMWYYHTHLVATHGYQSTPWQWLFDVRPVWYWVQYGETVISNIYAHSNPLILWLGLAAFLLQIKKIFHFPYFLFTTSYLLFTLPWIFSPRIMFFYHYLPSSVFLCVILAYWVSSLSKRSIFYILVLCSLSLLLISPMLYGFPTLKPYWEFLFGIFPTWK